MLDAVTHEGPVDAATVSALELLGAALRTSDLVGVVAALGLSVATPLKRNTSRRSRVAGELGRFAGGRKAAGSIVCIENEARA